MTDLGLRLAWMMTDDAVLYSHKFEVTHEKLLSELSNWYLQWPWYHPPF